jgi:hypothetical protein
MAQQLPIREREHPPDDAAVIIRAGVMGAVALGRAADRMQRLYGVLAISVECAFDASVLEACRNPRLVAYGRVRLSTAGRVRAGGFALVPTFSRPHFSLLLPDLSELTMARLERCFDAAIPNPGRPGNR